MAMLELARNRGRSDGAIASISDCDAAVIGLLEPAVCATAAPDASRPILLLHGFAASTRGLLHLGRELERALGRKTVVVANSSGSADLRERARDVGRALDRLAAVPGFEYADVVGHSMGGLVATYLLKRVDGGRRVRNVLTLGTPHRGAPLARVFSVLFAGLSRVMRQMTPRSGLLEELKWMPVPSGCRLVSIAGERDQVVPASFARLMPLPGHRNLRIPGATHSRLLLSPSVLGALCCALNYAPEPVGLEALAA
jgi:pimeloyl-ACP methyl ester carboxylesterase